MKAISRRLSISILLPILIALLCGRSSAVAAQGKPAFFPEPGSSIWISTTRGADFDIAAIIAANQSVRRVYLPLYQREPALDSSMPLAAPMKYLEQEKRVCEFCHKRHIEVFGIFTPLSVSEHDIAKLPKESFERGIQTAFLDRPTSTILSIYDEGTVNQIAGVLRQCLDLGLVDGVVLNCNYPATELYGYSPETREHFVTKYQFDPVDFLFPLGLASSVPLKDQTFAEIITQDRLDRFKSFISTLIGVCNAKTLPVGLLGLVDLYEYPATTRAAVLCDWAKALLDNPAIFGVLSLAPGSHFSTDLLQRSAALTTKLGIESRVALLCPTTKQDADAVRAFNSSRSARSATIPGLKPLAVVTLDKNR